MVFTGLCLITEDLSRLVAFYSHVLNTTFTGDEVHAEAVLEGACLAINARQSCQAQMGFEPSAGLGTGNVTLMFRVNDVDGEYRRILPYLERVLTTPKTHPWGAREFHFMDHDGKIVDFLCPGGPQWIPPTTMS